MDHSDCTVSNVMGNSIGPKRVISLQYHVIHCLIENLYYLQYEWSHADPEKNIRESLTVYKFQYLPAGLFNRAQVRSSKKVPVFRVTRPYLNLLVKPRFFSVFW